MVDKFKEEVNKVTADIEKDRIKKLLRRGQWMCAMRDAEGIMDNSQRDLAEGLIYGYQAYNTMTELEVRKSLDEEWNTGCGKELKTLEEVVVEYEKTYEKEAWL